MFINSSVNIEPIVRKVSPVVLAIARIVVLGCGEFPGLEGGQIDGIDVVGKGGLIVPVEYDFGIVDKAAQLYEREWLCQIDRHHFDVLLQDKDYPEWVLEEENPLFLACPHQLELLPFRFLQYLHLNLHILGALVLLDLRPVVIDHVLQHQSIVLRDLEGSGALEVREGARDFAL